jgi:formate dehydrogenase iron-sulfur subunit
MAEKVMLIDVSKCTACRACQVACKQWNKLPAEKTEQRGTHQNPPDLTPKTWNLVRYTEISMKDEGVRWLFRKDNCMHCTDPACQRACPVQGCIFKTAEGAVVIDEAKCIGCKYCVNVCPFEIPRYDNATNKVYKCTLCWDRISAGQIPACAKACAPGAVTFGPKDEMIGKAYARAKVLGGDAMVYGDKYVQGTHVVYVLPEKVQMYEKLPVNPSVPWTVIVWKDVLKPLTLVSLFGGMALTFLYYILKGPKVPTKEKGKEDEG